METIRLVIYILSIIIVLTLSSILNRPEYVTALIISGVGMLTVEVMYYLTKTTYAPPVVKAFTQCYFQCDHPICNKLNQYRGRHYFLTPTAPIKLEQCMISLWRVLHVILFIALGFFVPNIFPEIILGSIIYESAEYYICKCHDPLDIIANLIGYGIGVYFSHLVKP